MNCNHAVWFRLFYWVGLSVALSGCATGVSAIHDPLYKSIDHVSTIEATARNNDVGISRITITVTTGEMSECAAAGQVPAVIPCRRSASTVMHSCDFVGAPSTATCTYSTEFLRGGHLVTYWAEAEPVMGRSARTRAITFASGRPLTPGMLRPVWWHRGEPAAQKIDIGFFPDPDYDGLYAEFTADMEVVVRSAFFSPGQNFALYYSFFRDDVNLWAAPFGADAEPYDPVTLDCPRTYNDLVRPILAELDGKAILHRDPFRDCASISEGGAGSVSANDPRSAVIFTHESGHFLHGQGDEYCCDGGYRTVGNCANVFSSQADCQAAAPGHDADSTDCDQIGGTGVWRNDNGNLELMDASSDNSSWEDDSSFCVIRRFLNCQGGSCY